MSNRWIISHGTILLTHQVIEMNAASCQSTKTMKIYPDRISVILHWWHHLSLQNDQWNSDAVNHVTCLDLEFLDCGISIYQHWGSGPWNVLQLATRGWSRCSGFSFFEMSCHPCNCQLLDGSADTTIQGTLLTCPINMTKREQSAKQMKPRHIIYELYQQFYLYIFFQNDFPHPLPGGHLTFRVDSPHGAGSEEAFPWRPLGAVQVEELESELQSGLAGNCWSHMTPDREEERGLFHCISEMGDFAKCFCGTEKDIEECEREWDERQKERMKRGRTQGKKILGINYRTRQRHGKIHFTVSV